MTQDEILEIAQESGLGSERWTTDKQLHDFLERFAALVAAHEREACAKVCEENGKEPDDHKAYEGYDEGYQDGSNNCAASIRAR